MSTVSTQTRALLLDAYRELNSKKLFWITMLLSGLVVFAFAGIGVNEKGVTLWVWNIDVPGVNSTTFPPARLYLTMFAKFGIGFWLSWLSMILALISTAGMIPDLISGGAVELTLSKPLTRARLFLTKYAFGLLFTALQVTLFSLACFLLVGIRGHAWVPRLFLAVPFVVSIFSFLFCICVLLGLITRSTVASLLLTLLLWCCIFLVNTSETVITQFKLVNDVQRERLVARIPGMERSAANKFEEDIRAARKKAIEDAAAKGEPTDALTPVDGPVPVPTREELEAISNRIHSGRSNLIRTRERLGELEVSAPRWALAERIALLAKTPLPKTMETAALMDRYLLPPDQVVIPQNDDTPDFAQVSHADQMEAGKRLQEKLRARNVWWILGTSFAFEGVVLGIGVWIFCRRDF